MAASELIVQPKNEIVVYQPDATMRLEVRVHDESVWLTQSKLGELFGVDRSVINKHIKNVYKTGELEEVSTCAKIAQVQNEGVFTLLAERGKNVMCTIYSRGANKRETQLAASRYAQQYPAKPITLIHTAKSHDRFLIIDNTVWHVDASPKDAGARIFALMKMELDASVILGLLK